jgi:4-hydroxy-2-oxoglutarate aldolase
MIYNFPVVTAGLDLDSDTILALAKHPNIVGTKLSCGNIGKLQRLASVLPSSEFAVFAGRSDFFLHGLLSGSAGTIAALVNIVPKMHGEVWRLWKEGKIEDAMALQAAMGHADWAVQKIGGVAGVKSVVSRNFGYGSGTVRGPLKTLGEDAFKGNLSSYYSTLQAIIEEEKKL